MAICFDIYCPKCELIIKDAMLKRDEPIQFCPDCLEKDELEVNMRKMMGTHSFELKYDNRKDMCDWNGNTSKYWDDIKKEGGDEPKNPRQPDWY